MGSSSSFTVGLLHALSAQLGRSMSADELAETACRIEIDRLHEPIGKQDQYIAAFGGLQFIEFRADGSVSVERVACSPRTTTELGRRLLLFFTGMTRDAREVLRLQQVGTADKRPALRELCRIARAMRDVLVTGSDLDDFGRLLHNAWEIKKSVEDSISNPRIDELYARGREVGALGGKLLGAGSGGFLLFYCKPEQQGRLRESLAELIHVPFGLEHEGSKVLFKGDNR
ncbi:MAG: hypothetical protein JNL96_07525 [Planctomycetaceae bacterium]|nr:hypothetical protein [Planctomycetaceae bacterium]